MKKLLKRLIPALLCAAFLLIPFTAVPVDALPANNVVRVGLSYGSGTIVVGSLENVQNSGYKLGYYDENREFVLLATTEETRISTIKTETLYLSPSNLYVYEPDNAKATLGCYHIQVPGVYEDFGEAQLAAQEVPGGFVAWIKGAYYVRTGTYDSYQSAVDGMAELGIEEGIIRGTSEYAYNVVITGTVTVLFQFDGGAAGETCALGVEPGLDPEIKATTKYRSGNTYYGGFRFERMNGGDSTVVNMVNIEDYVKCVIPYEMSSSWPLEALKAQAVCARGYASFTRHSSNHFDVCTSTDCQVYYGTKRATEKTDQAVDETAGLMMYYKGRRVEPVYSASNGGASETCKNIWGSDNPYLTGKIDPYEADVADTVSGYYWQKVYTAESLRKRLHDKGYTDCGPVECFFVSKFSDVGNAIEIKIVDANGKTFTFSRNKIREILAVNCVRFTISVSGGASGGSGYLVAEKPEPVTDITTLYAISGNGSVGLVAGNAYAITGSGKVEPLEPVDLPSNGGAGAVYTINGAGNGHSLGMSQWGAYAMANRGYDFMDILNFYYTDITIE